MRTNRVTIAAALFAVVVLSNPVNGRADDESLQRAAKAAVDGDQAARAAAIALLRREGPAGLLALVHQHAALVEQLRPRQPLPPYALAAGQAPPLNMLPSAFATQLIRPTILAQPAALDHLREALDQVAQQRGAHTALLYWYTDLGAAQEAARRLHRPILSLRLLGKLTDEYSCANSRFFRTVFYANREVSDTLREQFVLHWSSERPVPVVTIDFGDGRVLKRTLTGNSAHYVLDSNGRPVDVLPGLYGPKAFLRSATEAAAVAREIASLTDADARQRLAEFHRRQLKATVAAWRADLEKAGGPTFHFVDATTLIAATSDELWSRIGALHAQDSRLDASSKELVRREQPLAGAAMMLTISKARVEDPLLRVVMELEANIARDTVRNEYRLHATIHEWFIRGENVDRFANLNARVYSQLFLTPAGDPWMGLAPAVYTGLDHGGLVQVSSH